MLDRIRAHGLAYLYDGGRRSDYHGDRLQYYFRLFREMIGVRAVCSRRADAALGIDDFAKTPISVKIECRHLVREFSPDNIAQYREQKRVIHQMHLAASRLCANTPANDEPHDTKYILIGQENF